MNDHLDQGWRDFYASDEAADGDKSVMPVFVEIKDRADDLRGVPPLNEMAAAGAMEIAKVLTRFDDQIEDDWRHNLIMLAAGLLRFMNANIEEKSGG